MNSQVFDIDKFNIIQDEENYYFFRALNRADSRDISENITSDGNRIQRIRTDRERFEEEKGTAKYNANSEISLEEVWDHIKIRYIKETNCISLSSNANVSIDYGQGYDEQYVMIKVPKHDKEKVYNAGQYMLEEIDRIVQEELSRIPEDSEIWDIIRRIDDEESAKNVRGIVADAYEGAKTLEGRFTGKNNQLKSKTAIISRLDRRQYFTEEQQLEYNKIIAKLTVLETRGHLRSIIPTKADNSSLIATIGIAFSSGELVHYKDIEANDIVQVPKEMMDILSFTQQLRDKGINNEAIKQLEIKVLGLINSGYKFSRQGEQLVLENGEDIIPIKDIDTSVEREETEDRLNVEDIYQITKGKISYEKAKIAIEFVTKLSKSRLKALEYADIIQVLSDENEELANLIKTECYGIDKDIISREDNEGLKIAESVNIGLSREQRRFISNTEQLELIRAIQELGPEALQEIIKTKGLSIESHIFDNLLDKSEEISENQYFAEAIIDGLDFEKIYKSYNDEKRIMTEEEKQLLVSKLMGADCKRLYNSFINAGIEQSEISGYVINILMNNGYKGHTIEELSQLEDLDELIEANVKNRNLKNRVQALRLDKLLGIEDDSHIVPETEIRLRDYQQVAIDRINDIYKDKRFASVILPTGAGKSFVAMAEMMNFKNSNIVFMAPQTTILTQFQSHIIKNILKRKDVPIKEYSKVIEEAFPSLKTFCYETLSKKDEEWLASHDADFIIFDELHRAGAKTWQPQIQRLIDNNPNAKILGMTATPIRDMDHKDMSRGLAEMTGEYTSSELIRKEHQATEMTLLDAMQDGLVVSPRIVTFDYTLGESQEYQQVKEMIDREQDPAKKEQLKQIYKEMTAIIKNSEKDGMSRILAENIKKKDGRYIVFLPNNNTELPAEEYIQQEIERVKEYFKDIDPEPETSYLLSGRKDAKKENAKALESFEKSESEHIKLIFAIDMLNEGVHVDDINGAIMLRPISENSRILYQQQIGRCVYSLNPEKPLADEDRPIIFDVYNNYLAQNMDREANRTNSTSDLQRLQAIINWIENHKGYIPDINSEDTKEARKAVTLKNIQKKYSKYIEGIDNKNLTESELFEIQSIIELGKQIELWDMEIPERIIPPGEKDIIRNDTFKVTGTQREFLDLFKKAKALQKDRRLNDELRIRDTMLVLDVLAEYGIEINNKTINLESTLLEILEKESEDIREMILQQIDELGLDKEYDIGQEYNFVKEKFFNGKNAFDIYEIEELRKCGIFEEFISSTTGQREQVSISYGKFIEKRGPKKFKGLNIITGTRYDETGYDINDHDEDGYNRRGFNDEGYHKKTGTKYNEEGYNQYGYNEKGYDREGYDKEGYDEEGYNRRGLNAGGFNRQGIHYRTNTKYDPDGYNQEGYNKKGYDRSGYDKEGYNEKGYDKEGYDRKGLNEGGFNRDGIHYKTKTKYDPAGYDKEGYNEKGYNREGYDREGYNKKGYDRNGYDREGYNEKGYDREGYNKLKFNKDGIHKNTKTKYDEEGYNQYGYNEDGYDREGYNKLKFDRDGIHKVTKTIYNEEGYNQYGYNEKGYDREGYDKEGYNSLKFNRDGIHKVTGTKYNEYGVNQYNFDAKGSYYKVQEDGTYIDTGLKYNPQGFNAERKHRITGTLIDLRRFDIDGKCKANNDSIYDKNGYKQDGTYMETGEMYHNGYNAWGVDEKGLDKAGKEPREITFTKEYVGYILKHGKKGMDYVMNKWCPRQRNSYMVENAENYETRKNKFIREKLGTAELMFPTLKKYIAIKILTIQKEISQREAKIKELEEQKKTGLAELEELRRENAAEKEKLSYLSRAQDTER